MRRIALVLGAVAIAALAVYWFALRGSSDGGGAARPSRPVARIGEGKRVLVVAEDGRLIGTASGDVGRHLPVLPLEERPRADRVKGHVLEQVKVVAAAPRALRPYLARTDYGETGVDVELTSGIQIRFGDDHEAARKWRAAAAILADPSVTLLSYVDVHAPAHPAAWGEEHELPPAS